MQEIKTHIKGLYTHPSDLSSVPDGALSVADNIVIDHEDIAEPRRGYNRANSALPNSETAKRLATYQNYLFAISSANVLRYYTTKLDTNTANFAGSGSWTTVGTYAPPSGVKTKFVEANQNLYWTTAAGIYKLDAYNGTPTLAGAYKALDVQPSIVSASGNWLATSTSVAYRLVWGYKDANQNLILGAPSQSAQITNTSVSASCVQIKSTLPAGITTAWFYQLYRSAAVNGTPSDELGLVYEANPTNPDISNGYIQFNDIVPDSLRGATIYTAASQQGIANANERPPLATDVAVYRNVTFYANTTSKQREYVTLLGVGGTNGLALNDTLTIGGVVYTAKTAETASSGQFRAYLTGSFTFTVTIASPAVFTATAHGLQNGDAVTLTTTGALPTGLAVSTTYYVITATTNTFELAATLGGSAIVTTGTQSGTHTLSYGGSASQNITNTANSLVRVINQYASSTVYAFYLSGPADLPGALLLEERSIGGNAWTTTSTNGTCWSPVLSGSGDTSSNNAYLNGLYYSKTSQPEAVPLANYYLVGSALKKILRILPLRDSLFILKEDGVFRLSGLDSTSFRVDPFDATTHLLAPDTAVVLNNQVYGFTDQGVVAINESGVQVKSRPIEYDLLSLEGQNYAVLKTESFGISYETERKFILFVPTLAADTYPTQAYVFNTFTNTWTRWPLAKTCGLVNTADDKLYLGDAATAYVNQERKSFSYQDYVDYGFSATISAVSGTTLTMTNTDNISVGDVIYQSSSVYSTVAAVNAIAGTVTTTVTAAFTAASTDVLKAITSKIAWVPFTGGNPGVLKQFREVSVLFKSDFSGNGTLTFTSDTSPSQETETLTGTALGTWGLFLWGLVPWGGTTTRRPIRVYVPTNKQRCSQLTVQFQQSTGYTKFQLNGLSLIGNFGSEKLAY